jgi:hypothetical protein
MASEDTTSIEYVIKMFIKINPKNDYKMIIGLNKFNLFDKKRDGDNIQDVDVIINYDTFMEADKTEILEYNGRFILILRLDINREYLKLSNFGVSEIFEKKPDTFENNVFGRFREISFDWSTVKFLKNDDDILLKIILTLTILLNRERRLYLPNLSEINMDIVRYNSLDELFDKLYLNENGKVNINLRIDTPKKLILKKIFLINILGDMQLRLGSNFTNENIFYYNYRVLQYHGFDVNISENPLLYPIRNSTEIDYGDGRITDRFYIITSQFIPKINFINESYNSQNYPKLIDNIKNRNIILKKFYDIKNKYLNYKDKYLKYKLKYLKLKNKD